MKTAKQKFLNSGIDTKIYASYGHLGKKHSKKTIKQIFKKAPCKICGKRCSPTNLSRWHNDNCKEKN